MNKEELELYDMVLNSEKSFDVNYKELAISLRAELELYKDNEEYLNNKIDKAINILEKDENKEPTEVILNNIGKALDILKGIDNE